jgi:Domain of unknown function (DUF4388)
LEPQPPHEVQIALFDLHRYLLDQIPPLTASDAVETLMAAPPELLMQQVRNWSLEQARHQDATQGDLLYHALRKIHIMSMLKLVDRTAMESYLDRVLPLALQACPEEEREPLRTSVIALRDSVSVEAPSAVVAIGKVEKSKPTVRGAVSEAVNRSTKRLSMMVERLAKSFGGSGSAPARPVEPQPAAQLVSMAAASSTSEEELKAYLQQVGSYTGETDPLKLFKVLAAAVPQWEVAAPAEATESTAIAAMHKIITLTSDTQESARRLRELMSEAVSHFNSGALGASLSMLELAAKVIREKKIDPSTVDRIFHDSVESISAEQLRKYAENKAKHAILRKALSYFPTLTRESLFEQLRGEQRPERRRSLLGLLEAYGADARSHTLVELEKELARPEPEIDTYYLRNVIYLLHRIPRETDEGLDKELELLTRASSRGQNIYVIKEAVIPLGFLRSEAAARVLTTRLAEFEAILLRKDTSLYPMDEMQKVLDRITAALGRIATPAALLTIARHGMKPNPLLGDARGRLAVLAQHDLSFDEQTVDILLKCIRDDLPTKILGRVITSQKQPPLKLIEALSGTRSEKVEMLLSEVAEKFADVDVGRAAAAALLKLGAANRGPAAAKQGATLTGDLDFFGLPSLMQSLADQQATGIVTLVARASGQTAGKLLFANGKFADAQTGHLRGAEAIYQLLEKPVTGTFAFVPHATAPKVKEVQDVMGLLFEGIRRHDELRQIMIFVPDDLTLRATATKPTPDPEETDPSIIREVWVKACSGARLAEWEATIAVDSYRIRRLVGRWVEEGALQPVA